jgi:hypothetical protein
MADTCRDKKNASIFDKNSTRKINKLYIPEMKPALRLQRRFHCMAFAVLILFPSFGLVYR